MTTPLPTVYQLEELLQRPELLRPPPAVLPRLAWEGRATLLAGPEKGGKSTLIGQGVAAGAQAIPFLGEAMVETPTLWFAVDEPLGDLVRRLERFGARRQVAICQEQVGLHDLEFLIGATGARLLVIDTLVEFFSGVVEAGDINNAMAWSPVLKALRDLLQRTGCAALLLHHTTREGSRYADSRQLGAGVDAIVTMSLDPADETVRKIDARGRLIMERFRIRYAAGLYHLDEGELPLELRVYQVIEAEPGMSANAIATRTGCRKQEILSAIARLLNRQAIRDGGDERRRAFFPTAIGCANGTQTHTGTSDNNESPKSAIREPLREPVQVVMGTSGNHSGTTTVAGTGSGGLSLRERESPPGTASVPGLLDEPMEPLGDAWEEVVGPEAEP